MRAEVATKTAMVLETLIVSLSKRGLMPAEPTILMPGKSWSYFIGNLPSEAPLTPKGIAPQQKIVARVE
jgi:hypothetical protein